MVDFVYLHTIYVANIGNAAPKTPRNIVLMEIAELAAILYVSIR